MYNGYSPSFINSHHHGSLSVKADFMLSDIIRVNTDIARSAEQEDDCVRYAFSTKIHYADKEL